MTSAQRLSGDNPGVRRTVLPGGLRVITESLPAVRSAALGIKTELLRITSRANPELGIAVIVGITNEQR